MRQAIPLKWQAFIMSQGAMAGRAICHWLLHVHFVNVSAILAAHARNCLPESAAAVLHIRDCCWTHADARSCCCVLQTHRSGLVQAVGGDSGVITRGCFGTITLWPEAELRSLAEAAGFVLPPPAAQASGNTRDARCAQARGSACKMGPCLVWPE